MISGSGWLCASSGFLACAGRACLPPSGPVPLEEAAGRGRDGGSGELNGEVDPTLDAEISVVDWPFLRSPPGAGGGAGAVLLFWVFP